MTKEIKELLTSYHEGNLAWGSLHAVLDDGNVENSSVQFCLNYAREQGDKEGVRIAEYLLTLSKKQRWNIYKNF